LNVDREVNQVKGIIYPRKGEEKMACKKQIVKVYPDKTKTYSCGNCAELPTCKRQKGDKMIKVFIPEVKRKYGKKELARGFWQADNGKIYYDYIKAVNYNQSIEPGYYSNLFYNYLDTIKTGYSQEAIFYKINNIGYIYYNRGKIEVLPHRIYKEVSRDNLKVAIKEALKRFSGCTIYNEVGRYYIEIFKTI
jgi:polyferredoxin